MTETEKKIRVGVVGVGYLGKFHAEKYATMAGVELVGVADINTDRAAATAEKFHTKAFQSHLDLLGKVDAVSIVVPTQEHFSVTRDFLMHHVDVMVEKPMTSTLAEAEELIRLSEARGLILQVGHLERFNPALVQTKDIVIKPMFIESHRLSIYNERGTDVSVVLDLMIHDIDIILDFVQSPIKSVHAAGAAVVGAHVDIANARLEFESGCIANVTASRISTKSERKIRLFQRDAYVSVDFASREITVIRKQNSSARSLIPGMAIEKLHFEVGDALEDELAAFIHAVVKREIPKVTACMGRDALKIALIIMGQIQQTSRGILDT